MSFQNFNNQTDSLPGGNGCATPQGVFEVKGKSPEDVELWLAAKLAELLNINADEIDVQEPFANFGLNSIAAVSLSGDLEEWLGCELPATLLWDYPTIEALARYITEELIVAG